MKSLLAPFLELSFYSCAMNKHIKLTAVMCVRVCVQYRGVQIKVERA